MGDLFVGLLAVLSVILGYLVVATVSFGSVLAIVISWNGHRSVLWAIVHGWFSWFYVIYWCLRRK